jgi:putative MATE family efflux protein
MKDLTQGSIQRHIVTMSIPIAIGMLVQTLYVLVDMYFVARLGGDALAGVSAAGNVMFIVLGLTQMLSIGTSALISHAAGAKDREGATLVFNQSLLIAALCAIVTLAGGYALLDRYMQAIAATPGSVAAGAEYLRWYLPGLALQFAIAAMGAALRGTGVVKPTMLVQLLTVVVNTILAPILIAGWGTGHALGVTGAALASTLSIAFGTVLLAWYFAKLESYVRVERHRLAPQWKTWGRLLDIGLPAGGEYLLFFAFGGVVFWAVRDFGAAAQAGFGVGMRVMQAIFLPGMAIAFAVPAIAGQNHGAKMPERVRETLQRALVLETGIMILLMLLCRTYAHAMAGALTSDAAVVDFATEYLQIIAWNFIGSGIVFACSGVLQGLGNTWPALGSTVMRLAIFSIPAIWLSTQPGFQPRQVWYVSVTTVIIQALVNLVLVHRELRKKEAIMQDRSAAMAVPEA